MIELPEEFYLLLKSKYEKAEKNKDVIFTGDSAKTQKIVREVQGKSICFHLTELPSLEHRPEVGSISSNPFAHPEPELTVIEDFGTSDEFRIVLNKFPVVPTHFLLVTKEFKSQNTPLSSNELLATFLLLKKLDKSEFCNDEWFAFYNCGPESGASQPHKHIQFMTLPRDFKPFAQSLCDSSENFIPNQNKEPLQDTSLPFAHYVAKLPDEFNDDIEGVLTMIFASLLQRVLNSLRENNCESISYNFCATTKFMMLVPRSKGKFKDIGINSCGFMGLMLCKNPEITSCLLDEGFENVLKEIGLPKGSNYGSTNCEY